MKNRKLIDSGYGYAGKHIPAGAGHLRRSTVEYIDIFCSCSTAIIQYYIMPLALSRGRLLLESLVAVPLRGLEEPHPFGMDGFDGVFDGLMN